MGLILKMNDPETEESNSGAPFVMEKLQRPDLPTIIWEVLERFSDALPSELLMGVPPA